MSDDVKTKMKVGHIVIDYPFLNHDGGRSHSKRKGQRNDCAVRVLAIVAGMSYDDAHDWLAAHGRDYGAGAYLEDVKDVLERHGFTLTRDTFPSVPGHPRMNPPTFTRQFPVGGYIVSMARHVAVVSRGILIDDHPSPNNRCIYQALKVEPWKLGP